MLNEFLPAIGTQQQMQGLEERVPKEIKGKILQDIMNSSPEELQSLKTASEKLYNQLLQILVDGTDPNEGPNAYRTPGTDGYWPPDLRKYLNSYTERHPEADDWLKNLALSSIKDYFDPYEKLKNKAWELEYTLNYIKAESIIRHENFQVYSEIEFAKPEMREELENLLENISIEGKNKPIPYEKLESYAHTTLLQKTVDKETPYIITNEEFESAQSELKQFGLTLEKYIVDPSKNEGSITVFRGGIPIDERKDVAFSKQ